MTAAFLLLWALQKVCMWCLFCTYADLKANMENWFTKQHLNHRVVWIGRDLGDYLVPAPLLWAGTSSTIPGCSGLRPDWSWTLPVMRHSQLPRATCARLHYPHRKDFFLVSITHLPSFSLKSLPLVLSPHAPVQSSSPSLLCAADQFVRQG